MSLDSAVMKFAASVNLIGCLLAYFVNPLWILLSVFVSLNLFQASITSFCPAATLFKKLGVKPGSVFQ